MKAKFSMIEMIVVMAVVSILASLVISYSSQAKETAKIIECKNNLKQIQLYFEVYKKDKGEVPSLLTDLNLDESIFCPNSLTNNIDSYIYDKSGLVIYDSSPEHHDGKVNIVYLNGSELGNNGIAATINGLDKIFAYSDINKSIKNSGKANNGRNNNSNNNMDDITSTSSGTNNSLTGNNGHGNNIDGVDSSNPGKTNKEDSDPNVDDEKNINDDSFEDYINSVNEN